MSKQSKKKKIKKGDYNRVLLTDTTPYEMPVIFSNDGFYERFSRDKIGEETIDTLRALILSGLEPGTGTVPMRYRYRAGSHKYRTLSLPHPSAQWRMMEFYKKFGDLICFYTTKSEASIRFPYKIAGSFHFQSRISNQNKYRPPHVDTVQNEKLVRHSVSYFAYERFPRLHMFFNSIEYMELEESYEVMMEMDIAKCFPSIYSHTITWATKSKQFKKEHLSRNSTFGDEFDEIIRSGNDRETNGIVIGPEYSRIFAEIILQRIDLNIIEHLFLKHELKWNEQYTFRRYIDNFYVFSNSKEVAALIAGVIEVELLEFNLHINDSKTNYHYRPVQTQESVLIEHLYPVIERFVDPYVDEYEFEVEVPDDPVAGSKIEKVVYSIPSTLVRSPQKLTASFAKSVKSVCALCQEGYGLASGYLSSLISRRILLLCEIDVQKYKSVCQAEEQNFIKNPQYYLNLFTYLLRKLFFLFSVSPSVSSSIYASRSIIVAVRFFSHHYPEHTHSLKQSIFDGLMKAIHNVRDQLGGGPNNAAPIEVLNLIIAMSELAAPYDITQEQLRELFAGSIKTFDYFGVVTLIFYMKDKPGYAQLRADVDTLFRNFEWSESGISTRSRECHTFFDMITCPYIGVWTKIVVVRRALGLNRRDAVDLLKQHVGSRWFVNWHSADILTLLERKQLRAPYNG